MIPAAQLIGTKLGSYEVQALLGSGGMASVFRAFDHNLQRQVAIKVLSEIAATQPGFAERFRQEALLLASLRHPNIVHIYDFGQQDGITYMVQELLAGPTLEERLQQAAAKGERLPRQEVISITNQLASALDAAHAAGIIHRDVKPSNAMWNSSNELVLTDFGIAKSVSGGVNHTQAGLVIGTPNYLSPEQAQGLQPTSASDIYALGVALYEMLAGKPPFEGDTPLGVAINHIQTPPAPLGSLRPDLPAAVDAVVQQALAKDPAARFRTAGDLARALEQAWSAMPIAAAAPTNIHNQATRVWEGPAAVATGPRQAASPVQAKPAPPAQSPRPTIPKTSTPAAPTAPPAASRRRGIPVLPLLGALLALVLLGGVVMAQRGGNQEPDNSSATSAVVAVATEPVAEATAVPATQVSEQPTGEAPSPTVAAPSPTVGVPSPTVEPTPPPTIEPTPPVVEPTPQPTPEPALPAPAPADPLVHLRQLIEGGTTSGQLGKEGNELLKKLDEFERALAKNDPRDAQKKLRELRKKLLEGAAEDKIPGDFAQQALAATDEVAVTYGLQLPAGEEGGDDKDKGDDKDD